MTKFYWLPLVLVAISLTLFSSCSDDDPDIPNEDEVITDVEVHLEAQTGGHHVTLTFTDSDGEGGNPPIITGGQLQADQRYDAHIKLYNKSVNPAEDITEEILDEADDHQFFFSSDITGLVTSYADEDEDGRPIGLKFSLITNEADEGVWRLILRHEPNKSAPGVQDGDITNAGGETDVEIEFPIEIL